MPRRADEGRTMERMDGSRGTPAREAVMMRRNGRTSRRRRMLQKTMRVLAPARLAGAADGRVTRAVLTAVGRLALRLGPA